MFMYYPEDNPAASIAPDVYAVLDRDLGRRVVYKFWEEGKPPDFALEVISPSSKHRNSKDKRALYARLGIGECFLFRPAPRKRGQRLVGFRLWGESYHELPTEPDGSGCSKALGVSFRVEGENLRVRNLASGQDYAWVEKLQRDSKVAKARAAAEAEARRQAESKAEGEGEARRQAEMRNAELQALLRQRS